MKTLKFLVLVSISYCLIACGGSPSQKTAKAPEKVIPPAKVQQPAVKLQLEEIEMQYSATQNITERNLALLELANNYQNSQQCAASNIIIEHMQASIKEQMHLAIANLLKAECALFSFDNLSDLSNKQPLINLIDNWLKQAISNGIRTNSITLDKGYDLATRTQIATAQLQAENKQYRDAIYQLLSKDYGQLGKSLDNKAQLEPQLSSKIWRWFSIISPQERAELAFNYPLLQEYKTLLEIIEDKTINDGTRQQNIKRLLSNPTNTALNDNLPQQVLRYLAINHSQNQRIAVLLPLSGRLAGQGDAIKQGMLSAYYQKLSSAKENNVTVQASIEFIDTGSLPTLKQAVTSELLAPFDTIVGPLLRSHIIQVGAFDLAAKHHLLLNQSQTELDNSQNLSASFALSPEQEAQQLVALMRARNIANPVIINDGSSTTRRMNLAFIDAWKASALSKSDVSAPLQEIRYSDNKGMRVGITSALDVLQSQKRIQQLSNLHQEKVHSVTRNRRDVDAFVIFARPNDVELINPIIESSISLFTDEQIPVFATSYSYDHKQSKNSQRDLRNLVFVDMPWLLPEGRNKTLSATVDTLFNEPPSAFLRLFAFGYDALSLVDNLAQLSTFEHLSVAGLSGDLSINEKQQLNRELSWLSITSDTSGQ